jgi:hypothetical protein
MRVRRICGYGSNRIVGLAGLLCDRMRGRVRRADNGHARESNEKSRCGESEFVCHVFHSFSCATSLMQVRIGAQEYETDRASGL